MTELSTYENNAFVLHDWLASVMTHFAPSMARGSLTTLHKEKDTHCYVNEAFLDDSAPWRPDLSEICEAYG